MHEYYQIFCVVSVISHLFLVENEMSNRRYLKGNRCIALS